MLLLLGRTNDTPTAKQRRRIKTESAGSLTSRVEHPLSREADAFAARRCSERALALPSTVQKCCCCWRCCPTCSLSPAWRRQRDTATGANICRRYCHDIQGAWAQLLSSKPTFVFFLPRCIKCRAA